MGLIQELPLFFQTVHTITKRGRKPKYSLDDVTCGPDGASDYSAIPELENRCPQCQTIFRDKQGLFNHQLSNKHFNLYCVLCDRTYSGLDKLRRHVDSVHSSQAYRCWMCSKVYNRSDNLRAHQMAAHGMVSCRVCQASFPEKEMLRQHMMSHSVAEQGVRR